MAGRDTEKVHIDAAGKSFGRLASEVATILMGKRTPAYVRNVVRGPRVEVINLRQVKFTGRKFAQKVYYRHTGYIGHLREEKLRDLWERRPIEVFRKTVGGMLPKNKLRDVMLKRLDIEL